MDIIQIDAKIRYYDDILDNQLSKIKPKPIEKMKDVIKEFSEDIPEASGWWYMVNCQPSVSLRRWSERFPFCHPGSQTHPDAQHGYGASV